MMLTRRCPGLRGQEGSITMRMRSLWWRLVSGGAAAALCPALLAGASAASAATPAAGARVTGGTWGTAKEMPGLAALNKSGDATVYSVSCPSPMFLTPRRGLPDLMRSSSGPVAG